MRELHRAIFAISSRRKIISAIFAAIVLSSSLLLAQQAPKQQHPVPIIEFPVLMRQKVIAGKTPIGTKVRARLTVATFMNGVVVPEGAVFSGEVSDSNEKSTTEPSRLAIHMDSAEWKNGSLRLDVYLTAWYYPMLPLIPADLSSSAPGGVHGSIQVSQGGTNSVPNSHASSPFPDPGNDPNPSAGSPLPNKPDSGVSKHRVRMKDVDSIASNHNKDEAESITLTSTKTNIKLDKSTTYVLATGDLTGPG